MELNKTNIKDFLLGRLSNGVYKTGIDGCRFSNLNILYDHKWCAGKG